MTDQKVATEVAELEFKRWAEAMDLVDDLDPSKMDETDKKELATEKALIIRALELGRLIVDDKGRFVYTPVGEDQPTPIVFSEPKGGQLMSTDKVGEGQPVRKAMGVLAEITEQPVPRFARMANRDLKICLGILKLFLAR